MHVASSVAMSTHRRLSSSGSIEVEFTLVLTLEEFLDDDGSSSNNGNGATASASALAVALVQGIQQDLLESVNSTVGDTDDDGSSSTAFSFVDVFVAAAKKSGVTVSNVTVDEDATSSLLTQLADSVEVVFVQPSAETQTPAPTPAPTGEHDGSGKNNDDDDGGLFGILIWTLVPVAVAAGLILVGGRHFSWCRAAKIDVTP